MQRPRMPDQSGVMLEFQRLRLGTIRWHLQTLADTLDRLEAELERADDAHPGRLVQRCDDVRAALELEWLKEYVSDIEWPEVGLQREHLKP